MERKRNDTIKKIWIVFGVIIFTSLCLVTFLNTVHLYYLQKEVQNLQEITSFLSNPVIIQSRKKRNVVGSTHDGISVSSETYAQHKRYNVNQPRYPDLKGLSVTYMPAQPSYFGSYPSNTISPLEQGGTTKKSPVHIRKSRVMHFENKSKSFGQIMSKPSFKSGDTSMFASNEYPGSSETEFSIVRDDGYSRRRNRQRMENLDERHPRTGRVKPLPTIHLSGDTSRYVLGSHENFNGNGHLRHLQTTYVDWKANNWVEKTGMDNHFNFQDGYLTIKEPGIYFVYAQIYYLDKHDRNGYRVYKNGDAILQCTVFAHSNRIEEKGNTCYTAGAEYIAEGDRISVVDVTDGHYSLFEPGKSFFGVIKLGDIKARM